MGNKHKATRHKNKPLSDYIYSIATLYCKVGLMPIKTGQFIRLYKIISHNLFLFTLQPAEVFLEHRQTFMVGFLCEKS